MLGKNQWLKLEDLSHHHNLTDWAGQGIIPYKPQFLILEMGQY